MLQSVDYAEMCDLHKDFMHDTYPDATYLDTIQTVCNEGLVLPEKKVGNVLHVPCAWLGRHYELSMKPAEEQRRVRLGWRRGIKYLVIISSPIAIEVSSGCALSPMTPGGRLLRKELEDAGINLDEVVVTYAYRFALTRGVRNYTASHRTACLPYLIEDIYQIRPQVIIACGAHAVKSLYGQKAKLDSIRGSVLYFRGSHLEIPVVPTVSHLAFLGGHANISVFRDELRRAKCIAEGTFEVAPIEQDYRVCRTVDEVRALCDEISRCAPPWLSFDTEFGNDVAREEFTYTLSVQLAWGPGKAAFIQLREQVPRSTYWCISFKGRKRKDPETGEWYRAPTCTEINPPPKCGVPMHTDAESHEIWSMLQQLLLDRRWRLAAQHLRVDVEQFARNGYPIDERVEDGIDTMLVHHLLYGDENQGLDHLTRKYAPQFGAYWMELEEWLSDNSRTQRLAYGYRDIPLHILIPYAQIDADVTWRIVEPLLRELKEEPRLFSLYWSLVAPTSRHLLDVERQGILVDEERRMELREAYAPVYDSLLSQVRTEVNWPGFNPGSKPQMASLLFTDAVYMDKKTYDRSDGSVGNVPEGVRGLNLTPLFNTAKYPRDWDDIVEEGDQEYNTPSTKAIAIDLLIQKYPDIKVLRLLKHLSVIGKFLSSYLAPQVTNEYGVPEDGSGFHNNIHADGRVRTHLSQITQTGRYTSKKANLQTKPKKQEAAAFAALVDYYFGCSVDEYKARIANDYEGDDKIDTKDHVVVPKFASVFIAPPGYCLIEADFATAELCIWAYCSGDTNLIDVVSTGRDMHSEICALSFKLPEGGAQLSEALDELQNGNPGPYEVWADGIKSKYGALRIAAKSVNFGVMYGRSAPALAREINKVVAEPVTVEDTQAIIDGLASKFPVAWQWLLDKSRRAVQEEFVEDAFGHRRYFQGASQMGRMDQAAVEREAKNSPIQGSVAYLLAQAGVNFDRLTRAVPRDKLDAKIQLPIHDAFLFCVLNEHVPKAIKAIDLCMATSNLIPGTDRHLTVDIEIFPHRWSDKGFDPSKPGQLEAFMALCERSGD